MMYSRGPRTEPCGRPYGAGTHRDLVEPWTTLKVRSWRKEPIHPRKLPDRPNVTFNRFRSGIGNSPGELFSLSFTWRSSNPCALFHHNSPGLLPIPSAFLRFRVIFWSTGL